MDLRLIIVLCALAAIQAAPQSEILSGQCAKQCKSSDLNEYPIGQTHVYKYSTKTFIAAWRTVVEVNGEAHITRLNTCDYSLELRNVAIEGVRDAKSLETQLTAHPMKFAWIDGEITAVCPEPYDEFWAANIKRAILSSIQTVGTSGYVSKIERDILGDCPTTYEQGELANDRIVMNKVKDISACQNHHNDKVASVAQIFLNIPLKPEYECKQIWTSRYILKSVKCAHVAASRTNVMANLTMELIRTDSKSSVKSLDSFRRSSLLTEQVEPPKKTIEEFTNSLTELCKAVEDEIKQHSAEHFLELVAAIRSMSYSDLKQVWDMMIDGRLGKICSTDRVRTMFKDALLQVRSGAALKLLINDLSRNNHVTDMEMKTAVYSLVYKPIVNVETMEAIAELLKSDRQIVQTVFGITAAIQKFYEVYGPNEKVNFAIDMLLGRFNRASEDEKIIYARALSNIRFDSKAILDAVERYIETGKPELRVAVIETLEYIDACNERVYGKLRKMVLTTSQPNEVRTRALKVLLRCGDDEAVNQLKSYIESHPEDKHFISYADSYLRNAMKTMNSDKQGIRDNANRGRPEWKEPKKTVSRNIEFSTVTIYDKLGLNYEVDSIVEEGKEMPVWIIFNSSVVISRVNQLNIELGLRQEGVEKLSAELMKQINEITVKDLKKVVMEAKEKRDVEPVVRELTKVIAELQQAFSENGQFSAYIKINGVTLFYWNGVQSSLKKQDYLNRFIVENSPSRKALEATLSLMLIDYQVNTPLASGLTLRYKHKGSLIPGVKASLKPNSADATSNHALNLIPNFAVEFVYGQELVLNKPIASQLTKVNTNSRIALDAHHSLTRSGRSKVHTLTVNTKDEMDLLRFDIVKITRDSLGNEIKEQGLTGFNQEWCSSRYTDRILGFAVCLDAQEDFNSVLLRKNARVVRRLVAKKTDKSLKTYELVVKMDEGIRSIQFNTPNTKVNRRVEIIAGQSGDYKIKRNFAGKFWILVNTPIKSFDVNVSASLPSANQWALSFDTQVDRKIHSARVSMEPKSNRQYILNLIMNSPLLQEKLDYDLSLTVPASSSEGHEMMAQIHSNMGNKRNRLGLIKLNRNKQEQYRAEFELNNQRAEKLMHLTLDGSIRGSYPVFTGLHYSGKVEYRRSLGKMENINFSGNYKTDTTGEAKAITNNLEVKTTQWPLVNGKVAHKVFFKPSEHLENEMEIRWGRDYAEDSTLNRIILRQVSSMKTGAKNSVEIKNSFIAENRAEQFNHKVEGRITVSPKLEILKVDFTHSNLNRPENNHKLVIDHKTSAPAEGTLNLILSSSRVSRSVKTSYAFTSQPKLNTIYKVEPTGQPVRGYHLAAALTGVSGGKNVNLEILSHPDNRQITKVEVDYVLERSKTVGNVKVSLRESNLITAEYNRDSDNFKAALIVPQLGSIESVGSRKDKTITLTTKDAKDWTHQFVLSNGGNIKSFKSSTLSGARFMPTFGIEMNSADNTYKFNYQTSTADLATQFGWSTKEKNLRVEFKCAEHNDAHVSNLKWTPDYYLLTSQHKRNDKQLYTVEIRSEKKNDLVHKMELKVAPNFEARVQHLFNAERRSSKLDIQATNNNNLDVKINTKIGLPVRRSRFSRMTSMEMPIVDIKAIVKRDGKESTMVISNTDFTKIHLQHRNRSGVPFVVDSKIESDKWTVVGHAGELRWNLVVIPQDATKSINVVLSGYGKSGELNLGLTRESSQYKALAQSKINFNRIQFDGQIESAIAHSLIAGPHRINIKNSNQELTMTYKLDNNKLDLSLIALENGQKLVSANFNGNKLQRSRILNVNGKLELTSEKYEALRKIAYEVKYNRDGRKIDMEVEKKGSNPMNLKLSTDISRESAKVNAEINGRTNSGKQRKLVIDYNRLNKIDFSAKLFDMSKIDSEIGVSIPLVKVAEFIGNEASLYLRSKSLNSEASFQLKAPSKTSVTGLANIKINGQQWLQYNLAVNDGSSTQFFGMERAGNQLENPIAILNDLYFKGKPIFVHHLLISDKLISLKAESPKFFKINQAFVLREKIPEVFGKYCGNPRCVKMNSKWSLGPKGLIEMTIEGAENAQQKYDVSLKWNQEQGREYGSVIVGNKGRQYGYEMSRLVKNSNNAVYESKVTLPKRVVTLTAAKDIKSASKDKYLGQWVFTLLPKANGDALKVTMERSIKRSSNNLKADHVISFEHKTLNKPIKVVSSVNLIKSDVPKYNIAGVKSADVKMGMNFDGSDEHELNSAFYFEILEGKMNYNWRVWQNQEKIDFGCKGVYSQVGSINANDLSTLRDCVCHWVNRNGERKELSREQKINLSTLLDANNIRYPRITFSNNMKHPLGSYFYNGTFHLAEAIKDATIDFQTQEGSRYQLQAKMDVTKPEKCVELTLFDVANAAEKYGLRSCLNTRARSGKSLFLFEMITFGSQVPMIEGERKVDFSIKRMRDFVNDYLISLKWDTNSMAAATYQAIDAVEQISNKRTAMITERDAELKDKMDYIRSVLGEKIERAREHLNRELNELNSEMKPETELISKMIKKVNRTRRGTTQRRPVDLRSQMNYEWRSHDVENGHLELILRNAEVEKFPLFAYNVLLKNALI